MVGYSGSVKDQTKRTRRGKVSIGGSKQNKEIDKENIPNAANFTVTTPPNKQTNAQKKRQAKSLTKTASRGSGLSKSNATPLQRQYTKTAPKTTPPRYSSIETVGDDPFQVLRDLPRTPPIENNAISPTSNMYRIDKMEDLVELGPTTTEAHFLSPILIRYSSPNASPIKPFALPTSPSHHDPSHHTTQEPSDHPAAPLDESHLSEVSLGATPQKQKIVKSASVFDLRAGAGPCAGAILATPRKVVVLTGGKRRRTFSPREQHPDLTLADMLHDLSFGTDEADDIPVAEDVAEVSKEEFLWSMKSGFEFVKHGRRGHPHKRLVWFDLDISAICWTECGKKKKIKSKRTMPLHEVVDIVYGTATPKAFARRNPDPNLCFSIMSKKRTLDLECSTEQVRDFWMCRFYLLKILQHELHHS